MMEQHFFGKKINNESILAFNYKSNDQISNMSENMDHLVGGTALQHPNAKKSSSKSFKVARLNIETELFDTELHNRKSSNYNPFSLPSNPMSPKESSTPIEIRN